MVAQHRWNVDTLQPQQHDPTTATTMTNHRCKICCVVVHALCVLFISKQIYVITSTIAVCAASVESSTNSLPILFQERTQPRPYRSRIVCYRGKQPVPIAVPCDVRYVPNQHYASAASNNDYDGDNTVNNNKINRNNHHHNDLDLSILEEHVRASVQSQIDRTRVLQALSVDEPLARIDRNNNHNKVSPDMNRYNNYDATTNTRSKTMKSDFPTLSSTSSLPTNSITDLLYEYETPKTRSTSMKRPISIFQISVAAAVVCGSITWIVLPNHNIVLALVVGIGVFLAAFLEDDSTSTWNNHNAIQDPNHLHDSGTMTGALARILGRTTLRSVQASEPKFKAIARVVLTGQEDIQYLQQTIQVLQQENDVLRLENQQLQQWKQTHELIYRDIFPKYTLVQLKDLAKVHQLPISGTKVELIERLLAAKVLSWSPIDNGMR